MTKIYCLGFAFSEGLSDVLLIEKARPDWQAGNLNGLGGKVKKEEQFIDAMCREFLEECGLVTTSYDWDQGGCIRGPDYLVYVYYSVGIPIQYAETTTDEKVDIYSCHNLALLPCLYNVPALVHLCLAQIKDPSMDHFVLNYT